MANQLYNQLNQKLTSQILNNMMRNNPQATSMLRELKESGCTPKDFFYRKADEMGVNPQDILKQIM